MKQKRKTRMTDLPIHEFLKPVNVKTNSHYDMKYYKTNNKKAFRPIKTKPSKFTLVRTAKLEIKETPKQRIKFDEWCEICRLVIGYGIEIQNGLKTPITSMKTFRDKYKKDIIKKIGETRITTSNIYSHTIDAAIKRMCTSYKSAFSNLKAKNITHFKIRPIRKDKPNQSFVLEASNFSKKVENTIGNNIGHINADHSFINANNITSKAEYKIAHEAQIVRDKNGKYWLHIFEEIPKTQVTNRKLEVGIDPGLRTFLTLYDADMGIKIGNNVSDRIITIKDKINNTNHRRKDPRIKKLHRRLYDKLKHLIDDLHWKVALFLVKRYSNIYLGKLSTKDCVSNGLKSSATTSTSKKKKFGLPKVCKDPLLLLRHWVFTQRLEFKANQYKCNLFMINEAYTTQACGLCCINNKNVGGLKTFTCPQPGCGYKWDRDINAGRNILLKGRDEFHPQEPPPVPLSDKTSSK